VVLVNVELSGALATVAVEKRLTLEATNIRLALDALAAKNGEDFKGRLFDPQGKPRRFINIYVNGRDYRFIDRLDTKLQDGDIVSIIPAVSGG
jgi:molybdopterin converting factor small subunit